MKGWTLLGVLLAVVGVVLFLNGLNNRLAPGKKPVAANPNGSVTAQPALPLEDSGASNSRPMTGQNSTQTPDTHAQVAESIATNSPEMSISGSVAKERPDQNRDQTPSVEDAGKPFIDLATILFLNDPDGRKKTLVRTLQSANWSGDDLTLLIKLLDDPRANFRDEILIRNSTFTETAEQYEHNLNKDAVNRSLQFLQDYRAPLVSAAKHEGVPSEILVAILKVETNLGEWRGKESVFNVYWSLALGDNGDVQRALLSKDPQKIVEMKGRMTKRAFWARSQLRDLLYVARHGGENPVGILGSFAGAFGLPQFIPSSYRSFGQDGNGDGIIDLDGIPDAARSIGYYLKENGWPNRPDRARMRKAILNYNHSAFYADCVLSLADSLSLRLNGALIAN